MPDLLTDPKLPNTDLVGNTNAAPIAANSTPGRLLPPAPAVAAAPPHPHKDASQ